MAGIIYNDQRIPDVVGQFGKAWKQDFDSYKKRHPDVCLDATIAGWIVFAPWAHPLWSYYLIAGIHLRDLPGKPPAKINLKGATHEVFVFALDPEQKRVPLNESPKHLTPINFVGQWIAESDADARKKIEATVEEIVVHGTLSPDTDFRSQWIVRFSDSNIRGVRNL